MPQRDISILSKPEEVLKYVEQARTASDTDKGSLGFLPERAYREAAEQGKLLIAVVREGNGIVYAGHLLHGGTFPQARIFQVFTAPRFRREGIARRLVETIVESVKTSQFMSVVAKVADDLAANQFWQRLDFEVIRTKPGGRTTGRQINIRLRELDNPNLFNAGGSALSSAQDLKLFSRLFNVSPIYVLDLNILYDLIRQRANAEDVGRIIRASFNNLIRLAVTEEFIKELERTSIPNPIDPILELALRLPRLPKPPLQRIDQIVSQLGAILFPSDISQGKLRPQDQSDLVHLATAIHNEASGFVTGEKAILRARGVLQSRYSLDVVGASEFADNVEPSDSPETIDVQASAGGMTLQVRPAGEGDFQLIRAFLGQMRCPEQIGQDAAARSDPGRPYRRLLVVCGGQIVAFGSWELPSAVRPLIQAFLCIDEGHASVAPAADFLLDSMNRESVSNGPTQVSLRLLPGHVTTRRIAIAHGFRPSANEPTDSTVLHKIALGRGVIENNWASISQQLKKRMGIELPESIPRFCSAAQILTIKSPTGQAINLGLEELETLLSPAIFFLPGRPAAIVPIRRVYAEELIGSMRQFSLLVGPEAVLLRERVYFSDPRTARVLTKGVPVFFYESASNGGSASLIAVARIVRTELVSKDGADQELIRRGVLNKKNLRNICLAETLLATTIDSIMTFKNPMRLERLRTLDAIDGANLVTARSLNGQQVLQIVDEGLL